MTALPAGVHRIRGFGVNAYLVAGDGEGPTLVDAGTPLDAGAVERRVERTGAALADVERVLLTHYDVDHVGGLAELARRGLDAPVYAADPDAGQVRGDKPSLANRKGLAQRLTGPLVEVPDLRVERVDDGERVGPFDVYHTPGHTAGHVAYEHEGRSSLFVGDLVIARGGRLRVSPWPVSRDTDAVAESVVSLADRAPAAELLAMGHGTPVAERGSVVLARLAAAAARRT
ncbi:MAG: Zn-dependent hydrolase [uncultured archaeon A07HB70]|nr:MAG: Zn-dependent hydrolase [uncultured archaeon A07HB70]